MAIGTGTPTYAVAAAERETNSKSPFARVCVNISIGDALRREAKVNDQKLSPTSVLISAMERQMAAQPYPEIEALVHNDETGTNPLCPSHQKLVRVEGQYELDEKGRTFLFKLIVTAPGQRAMVSLFRDVESEGAPGQYQKLAYAPLIDALASDLKDRVGLVLELIRAAGKPMAKDAGKPMSAFRQSPPGEQGMPNDVEPTPLFGSEIEKLITGRTMRFVPGPGYVVVTSNYEETYHADHQLTIMFDRASTHGYWQVDGDRLCGNFGANGSRSCREIFRVAGSGYYLRPEGAPRLMKFILD